MLCRVVSLLFAVHYDRSMCVPQPRLMRLGLARNALESLEGLGGAPRVQALELRGNALRTLEGAMPAYCAVVAVAAVLC